MIPGITSQIATNTFSWCCQKASTFRTFKKTQILHKIFYILNCYDWQGPQLTERFLMKEMDSSIRI